MASGDRGSPSSNTRSFSVDEVIDMMDSFYDDMGMEMDDLNEPVYAGSDDDLEPELERSATKSRTPLHSENHIQSYQ